MFNGEVPLIHTNHQLASSLSVKYLDLQIIVHRVAKPSYELPMVCTEVKYYYDLQYQCMTLL